jgi:hypothetical protein
VENNKQPLQQQPKVTADVQIGSKLLKILDDLLVTGDLSSDSLFLRNMEKRIKKLRDEVSGIVEIETPKEIADKKESKELEEFNAAVKPDYMRVYILVYQVEGGKIQNWQYALRAITEHNISYPTYNNENYVQEFIRSKKEMERYGYAIVDISTTGVYKLEKNPVDAFQHEMLVLKENIVKLDSIKGFVHANKRRYAFKEGKLVYMGDVAGQNGAPK